MEHTVRENLDNRHLKKERKKMQTGSMLRCALLVLALASGPCRILAVSEGVVASDGALETVMQDANPVKQVC